jgi:aspartyl-tRNA(Asn)/glutamyl-tRNA(Gln) amidotransferase subunit A
MRTDILNLTIADAAELLEARQLSPVDLVDAVLERIRLVDERVNAFSTVAAEESMKAARVAEEEIMARRYVGPLHGIPVAVKDNICVGGTRTAAGSKILFQFVPKDDATVVSKLRSAGAIIVGKNNMHEFAMGVTTANPHFGTSRNPWDLRRIVGGSSGGSGAAVAARECYGTLGTDTGGSVRLPAAINGVTGIRPTMGRVSNHGVIPLAWSSDTVGPLCRTARDCALMLEAISDYDAREDATPSMPVSRFTDWVERDARGLRIGIVKDFTFARVQPEVVKAVEQAFSVLQGLGMSLQEVTLDHLELNDAAQAVVELSESATYHQAWLRKKPHHYGEDVRALLELGQRLSAIHYIQAQRYRSLLRAQVLKAFRRVDVFAGPMVPCVAPAIGGDRVWLGGEDHEELISALVRYANLASLCGLPAISVPCGFSTDGLPIGLQVIGRPFNDATVLQVAGAYQSVTSWHLRTPPL